MLFHDLLQERWIVLLWLGRRNEIDLVPHCSSIDRNDHLLGRGGWDELLVRLGRWRHLPLGIGWWYVRRLPRLVRLSDIRQHVSRSEGVPRHGNWINVLGIVHDRPRPNRHHIAGIVASKGIHEIAKHTQKLL